MFGEVSLHLQMRIMPSPLHSIDLELSLFTGSMVKDNQ